MLNNDDYNGILFLSNCERGYYMEKYDLSPYFTTFKIALYMAEERYNEHKKEFDKMDTDGDGIVSYKLNSIVADDLVIKGKEKELFDFLNSLDYEVIKTLQVIKYIGRDSFCAEEDGTYNYEKSRNYFDRQGWNQDKSIEVHQMVEKIHLADYLKEGFRKLNITI